MSRLRLVILATARDATEVQGDEIPGAGASVRLYQPGTGATNAITTTGTPLVTPVYSVPVGGVALNPIAIVADASGQAIVWADRPTTTGVALTCDVGIVLGGVAALRAYERFEPDPSDLAWASDLPVYNAARPNLGVSALIEGATNAEAANNATKLHALCQAVGAAGGGTIRLPANGPGLRWWFPKNTKFDTGLTYSVSVSLVGDGPRATAIGLTGTTGPFLEVQTVASSSYQNWKPRIGGFTVWHDGLVSDTASGADFLLGPQLSDAGAILFDIEWSPSVAGTDGAWICIEAQQSVTLDHCLVVTRVDGAAPATTTCLRYSPSSGQFRIYLTGGTQLSGAAIGIDLLMTGTANLDVLSVTGRCLFSGLGYGVRNASANPCFIADIGDVQIDTVGYAVYSVVGGSGGFRVLNWHDCSSFADLTHIVVAGGVQTVSIDTINVNGGGAYYFANLGAGVTKARITNCDVALTPTTNATTAVGVTVAGTGSLEVANNVIVMTDATSRAAVEVAVGISLAVVKDNILVPPSGGRSIIAPGGRTSGRVFGPNIISDPNAILIDGDRLRLASDMKALVGPSPPLIWLPSWSDAATSTSLETATGRTITHTTDVTTNDREVYQGNDRCLVLFRGADSASTPDTADLSFTSGGLTFVWVANVTSSASTRTLVAKLDVGAAEYAFYVDASHKLVLYLKDNVTGGDIYGTSTNAIGMGRLHCYMGSWDGVSLAGAGFTLYQDNVALGGVVGAATGSYTRMRDTATALKIGAQQSPAAAFMIGTIGFGMIVPGVLPADERQRCLALLDQYFGLGL